MADSLTIIVGTLGTLLGTLGTGLLAYKTTLFQGKQRGEDLLLDSVIKEKAELQAKLDLLTKGLIEENKNSPLDVQQLREKVHERDLAKKDLESEIDILILKLSQATNEGGMWKRRCAISHRERGKLKAENAALKAENAALRGGDTSGSARIFTARVTHTSQGGVTEGSDLILLAIEDAESDALAEYDELDSQAIEDDLEADEAPTTVQRSPSKQS